MPVATGSTETVEIFASNAIVSAKAGEYCGSVQITATFFFDP